MTISVLDASVGIKQFIPDPLSPKVDRLFTLLVSSQIEIFVPDLFYIESANILWKYVRASLYPVANIEGNLNTLKALPLRVVSTVDLMQEAVNIGLNYGITAYDGCYVALSEQVNAPLLTLDKKLVNALKSSPYNVLGFDEFSLPPLLES